MCLCNHTTTDLSPALVVPLGGDQSCLPKWLREYLCWLGLFPWPRVSEALGWNAGWMPSYRCLLCYKKGLRGIRVSLLRTGILNTADTFMGYTLACKPR